MPQPLSPNMWIPSNMSGLDLNDFANANSLGPRHPKFAKKNYQKSTLLRNVESAENHHHRRPRRSREDKTLFYKDIFEKYTNKAIVKTPVQQSKRSNIKSPEPGVISMLQDFRQKTPSSIIQRNTLRTPSVTPLRPNHLLSRQKTPLSSPQQKQQQHGVPTTPSSVAIKYWVSEILTKSANKGSIEHQQYYEKHDRILQKLKEMSVGLTESLVLGKALKQTDSRGAKDSSFMHARIYRAIVDEISDQVANFSSREESVVKLIAEHYREVVTMLPNIIREKEKEIEELRSENNELRSKSSYVTGIGNQEPNTSTKGSESFSSRAMTMYLKEVTSLRARNVSLMQVRKRLEEENQSLHKQHQLEYEMYEQKVAKLYSDLVELQNNITYTKDEKSKAFEKAVEMENRTMLLERTLRDVKEDLVVKEALIASTSKKLQQVTKSEQNAHKEFHAIYEKYRQATVLYEKCSHKVKQLKVYESQVKDQERRKRISKEADAFLANAEENDIDDNLDDIDDVDILRALVRKLREQNIELENQQENSLKVQEMLESSLATEIEQREILEQEVKDLQQECFMLKQQVNASMAGGEEHLIEALQKQRKDFVDLQKERQLMRLKLERNMNERDKYLAALKKAQAALADKTDPLKVGKLQNSVRQMKTQYQKMTSAIFHQMKKFQHDLSKTKVLAKDKLVSYVSKNTKQEHANQVKIKIDLEDDIKRRGKLNELLRALQYSWMQSEVKARWILHCESQNIEDLKKNGFGGGNREKMEKALIRVASNRKALEDSRNRFENITNEVGRLDSRLLRMVLSSENDSTSQSYYNTTISQRLTQANIIISDLDDMYGKWLVNSSMRAWCRRTLPDVSTKILFDTTTGISSSLPAAVRHGDLIELNRKLLFNKELFSKLRNQFYDTVNHTKDDFNLIKRKLKVLLVRIRIKAKKDSMKMGDIAGSSLTANPKHFKLGGFGKGKRVSKSYLNEKTVPKEVHLDKSRYRKYKSKREEQSEEELSSDATSDSSNNDSSSIFSDESETDDSETDDDKKDEIFIKEYNKMEETERQRTTSLAHSDPDTWQMEPAPKEQNQPQSVKSKEINDHPKNKIIGKMNGTMEKRTDVDQHQILLEKTKKESPEQKGKPHLRQEEESAPAFKMPSKEKPTVAVEEKVKDLQEILDEGRQHSKRRKKEKRKKKRKSMSPLKKLTKKAFMEKAVKKLEHQFRNIEYQLHDELEHEEARYSDSEYSPTQGNDEIEGQKQERKAMLLTAQKILVLEKRLTKIQKVLESPKRLTKLLKRSQKRMPEATMQERLLNEEDNSTTTIYAKSVVSVNNALKKTIPKVPVGNGELSDLSDTEDHYDEREDQWKLTNSSWNESEMPKAVSAGDEETKNTFKKSVIRRHRNERVKRESNQNFINFVKKKDNLISSQSFVQKSIRWVLKMIRSILDAMTSDAAPKGADSSLKEYVYLWMSTRYGVKELISQACRDFYCSAITLRRVSIEIDFFLNFLDEVKGFGKNSLSFFLYCRGMLHVSHNVQRVEMRPPLLAFDIACNIASKIFLNLRPVRLLQVFWTIEYFCLSRVDNEIPLDNLCNIVNGTAASKFENYDIAQDPNLLSKYFTSFQCRIQCPESQKLYLDEYRFLYILMREFAYNKTIFSNHLRKKINEVDVTRSGCISLREFLDAMEGIPNHSWPVEELQKLFEKAQKESQISEAAAEYAKKAQIAAFDRRKMYSTIPCPPMTAMVKSTLMFRLVCTFYTSGFILWDGAYPSKDNVQLSEIIHSTGDKSSTTIPVETMMDSSIVDQRLSNLAHQICINWPSFELDTKSISNIVKREHDYWNS
eukprot:g1219.t1